MKKTLVFVSLVAVFLMIMTPNVSAIEFNSVEKNINKTLENKFDSYINFNENSIKDSINSLDINGGIFSKIFTIILFIIYFILFEVELYILNIFSNCFSTILSKMPNINENPIMLLLFFIIEQIIMDFLMEIISIPTDLLWNIIIKIKAWEENTLRNIQILVVFIGTIIYFTLYRNGLIPEPKPTY